MNYTPWKSGGHLSKMKNTPTKGVLTVAKISLHKKGEDHLLFFTVQNHEKQLRFYSTAKTKKKNNKRWAKPTDKEEKKAIAKLKKTSVKVCCVCWKEEDYNHDSNVDITWVECDSCKAWLHLSCTSTSDLTNDDEYYCKNCQ